MLHDALGEMEGVLVAAVTGVDNLEAATVLDLEGAIRCLARVASQLGVSEPLLRALKSGSKRSVFRGADDPSRAALALIRRDWRTA